MERAAGKDGHTALCPPCRKRQILGSSTSHSATSPPLAASP